MATSRLRVVSAARYTSPIPPSPIFFPLTLGISFAAKLVACLKSPSLSLFLEKATPSFQPQAFRGRMTAWSARNDCSWAVSGRSFDASGENLNDRF